jgi:hypothetical protein
MNRYKKFNIIHDAIANNNINLVDYIRLTEGLSKRNLCYMFSLGNLAMMTKFWTRTQSLGCRREFKYAMIRNLKNRSIDVLKLAKQMVPEWFIPHITTPEGIKYLSIDRNMMDLYVNNEDASRLLQCAILYDISVNLQILIITRYHIEYNKVFVDNIRDHGLKLYPKIRAETLLLSDYLNSIPPVLSDIILDYMYHEN